MNDHGIGKDWERWYRALKQSHPDAYQKAINYMESVTINHRTPPKAAAEYERSAVMLICDLYGVVP